MHKSPNVAVKFVLFHVKDPLFRRYFMAKLEAFYITEDKLSRYGTAK